jgi:hypothetical protein
MSLNAVAIDPLIDLLKFTGRESPALTELFCAPLKLLLSDSVIASKLSTNIPRKLYFAHRSGLTNIINSESGSSSSALQGYMESEGDFDTAFNGIRLLPRKLRPELVDSLSWQVVLRAVLLRLDPIKQLRKAAAEVPEATPVPAPVVNLKKNILDTDLEVRSDDVPVSSSSSGALRRLTFSNTLEEARGSLLDNESVAERSVESKERRLSLNGSRKKGQLLNKDHHFLVTSDPRQELAMLLEAAVLLETQELHTLSVGHKLAALKAVCNACYDTVRVTELLASNAEERAERVTAMNKSLREEKAKSKEFSVAMSKAAIGRCKEANITSAANAAIAAEAAAAKKGAGKKGAGKKTEKSADKSTDKSETGPAARPGPKPKGLSEPSPAQVAAMLEEMSLLEKLGVDLVLEGLPEEEPLSDEEEEEEYTLNADGTYTMRNRASVRGKANDRKKLRVERESRLIQVTFEFLSSLTLVTTLDPTLRSHP